MTQKELLYLEDAIGHENNIIMICESIIDYVSDNNILSFMESELLRHVNTNEW